MKVRSLFPALFSLALPMTSAFAQSTQVGTVLVKQNNAGNNAASVTLSVTAGTSDLVKPVSGNRGDYDMSFGNQEDGTAGTLISCVAENTRDNTAFGDAAAVGRFAATSSVDISEHPVTRFRRYFIPVNDTPRTTAVEEVNMNVAVGFFPYTRWLGGLARNAAGDNGGLTNQLFSHASIRLGTEFRSLGSGVFLLNLKGVDPQYTSEKGVVLVTHAKNEPNYGSARANTDGTFSMFVRDNAATGAANEQDPISFVFLPVSALNTDGLVTFGRVKSNATTPVLAGPAEVTKGSTGRWYIKIPDHSPETGTLLVSPEGGGANNFDNVVSYQWDAPNNRYIVESRDIVDGTALPALQNGAATEDMFSFAFFHRLRAPTVTLDTPTDGNTLTAPASIQMKATAADVDGVVSRVEFLVNGVVVGTDTEAPYEFSTPALQAGSYRCTVRAIDDLMATVETEAVIVIVNPSAPVTNPAVWFDGINEHVALGTAPELRVGGPPNNGFTLECWFRKEGRKMQDAPTIGRMTPLIAKGRDLIEVAANPQTNPPTYPPTENDINYVFGLNDEGLLTALFETYPTSEIPGGRDVFATASHPPIVDGQWYHAAVTYDAPTGTFSFYLDGVPVGTLPALVDGVAKQNVFPRYDNISPVGIGTAFNTPGVAQGVFPGVVDEVRIWNHVRSAAKIEGHRRAAIVEENGLVGRFGFNEGQGNQVVSSSGLRTRGTLVNEPLWVPGAPLTQEAPQVVLSYPRAGDQFAPGATIPLVAAAANLDATITKVEFFDGATKIGEATSAPFSLAWTGAAAGPHTLSAVATDAAGLTTTSPTVIIQVAAISPLVISEVHSARSATAPAGTADYWELTNTGATAVNVAGYTWDDSRRDYTTARAWALPNGTTLNAGESIIFTKTDPAVFRTWWGLSASVRVFRSVGSPDLDANDSITLYNGTGQIVTSLSYAADGFTRTNGMPSLGGQAGESAGGTATAALVWDPAFGVMRPRYAFAGAGINGGISSGTGGEVGGPGGGGGPVQEPATVLALAIAPKVLVESSLNPAATARLVRYGDISAVLEVALTSSDVTELTVPATVTLAAGEASVSFPVTAVNDFFVDGTQVVTVAATAPGAVSARQEMIVMDDGDVPPPDLRLTEVLSSQSPDAPSTAADYWEVTNFSTKTVSLDGYTWDDSRKDFAAAQAWKLPAGSFLAPGESAVLTPADPAAFRAWWGLDATVKVWQTPGAPDLEANDSITLFMNTGIEVFTFSYAASAFTRSYNIPALGGHAGPSAGASNDFTALVYDPTSTSAARRYLSASVYRLGGRAAVTSGATKDVGSPGVINGAPVSVPSPEITTRGPLQFTHVATVPLTGSEISAYDSASKRLFVTCNAGLQILAMNDPALPVHLTTINFTQAPFSLSSTDVTSVAVRNGVVAVAVPNALKDQPGRVVFLNASTGALLSIVTVGVLPDMITFTPNGARVLTANEGEMQSEGADTAPGSVSIIEVAAGFTAPTVTTVGFTAFDAQAATLKEAGVRIFENPPGSGILRLPSLDFEPEYIAVAPDSLTAMVTLQEANAVAILNLTTKAFTSIKPLGEKDFSSLLADFSDRDSADGSAGVVKLTTGNPVFGLYMPDAITAFQANGQTYYVTANEGDDRDDFQTETIRVGSGNYVLDPTKFPNAAEMKANNVLGRLTVSNSPGLRGDTDNDGDVDRILAYGGRSISILNAAGEVVYDSADLIERLVASLGEPLFDDARSDNKGPEPEGVAIGEIDGRLYAFAGLERSRGVMVFDVTDPTRVAQAGFVSLPTDMNPEGLTFIAGAQSPNGKPMLAVTNETSNTLSLFNISRFTLQLLHFSDAQGGLLTPQTAPNLAALVDAFEEDYGNTLIVSGGDSFIPGPFLSAGADPSLNAVTSVGTTAAGRPDLAIHNLIGVEASAIGHHEWDLGSGVFANAIKPAGTWAGAQFPLLALNLDFSADDQLSGLTTNVSLDGSGTLVPEATTLKGRLVPVTVVSKGGEKIGLVGVTTQLLASLTSPEGTVVKGGGTVNLDILAGQIQPYVNELTAEGVNKIILLSHLRDLELERALAVKLAGVDIIVAAGSDSRLGDTDDTAVVFPGHEANFAGTYPILTEDKNGTPLLIVSTDSEHTYLGRLLVDFDPQGVLVPSSLADRLPENGAYAATAANVAAAWGVAEADLATTAFAASTKGARVRQVTNAVQSVLTAKEGLVYGYTAVYLEGAAPLVSSEETNLGNLIADANQQALRGIVGGTEAIVSFKHAGGITGQVGAINGHAGGVAKGTTPANASAGKTMGGISQLDIENALRANQRLMVFDTTPAGLKAILEHGVSQGVNQAQFPQIGGVQFAWDPDLAVGSRVVSIALLKDDGTAGAPIFKSAGNLSGGMLPGAPAAIRVVTLNNVANGDAGYPMKANGDNFRYLLANGTLGPVVGKDLNFTVSPQLPGNGLSEQVALAEHVAKKHGNLAFAYRTADVRAALDVRIQNLNERADTVPPVAGQDSDGDGLSDLEELLLGVSRDSVLRVGDRVDLNLAAFAANDQTLKLIGRLPPGLTFNAITGRITGVISGNAALYDLQLLVMQGNVAVKAFNLQLGVEAFPARLLAGYEALLEDANGRPVGILRLAMTRPSLWTGSLEVIGQGRRPGTGSYHLVPGLQRAELQMVFKGKGTVQEATVTVDLNAESALVNGSFSSGNVAGNLRGFRLASLGGSPPTARKLNLALDAGSQNGVDYPAGFGWAKGSVSNRGAVSFKGQLGDAQAIVLAANLGVTGQSVVWTQPYKNKVDSYFGGVLALPNVGQPAASLEQLVPGSWWFKAADVKELSYSVGFAQPLPVTGIATVFDTVKTSSELESALGLAGSTLHVEIEGAGLSNAPLAPIVLPTAFTLAANFALTTSAPVSGPPVPWTGKINKADGALTGTLTLPAGAGNLAGKAAATGVLLQDLPDGKIGAGFIRVPVSGKKGEFQTSSLLLEK